MVATTAKKKASAAGNQEHAPGKLLLHPGAGDGEEDDNSSCCYTRRVRTTWHPGGRDRNDDVARDSIVELDHATLYDFDDKNEEH